LEKFNNCIYDEGEIIVDLQINYFQIEYPKAVGIWGGGLIGLSTAAHFAKRGIKAVIYDIDASRVEWLNHCEFPPNFESWVGFDVRSLVESGKIIATDASSDLLKENVGVHFIAVPTEDNGQPCMRAVDSVIAKLSSMKPELCIIESTLSPGCTEKFSQTYDIPLGVATRRDWFTTSQNNLENCVRVYCGTDKKTSDAMQNILGIVCKNIIRASSTIAVELTKCLDNGIFHTVAMYASQVAVAYPNAATAEALELASTHWRLGNHVYFPSTGTGGHCVPLANKYLLSGAENKSALSICNAALNYDRKAAIRTGKAIAASLKPGDRICVLGICYRGDIRVVIESPHLKLAGALLTEGIKISIHDPYYSSEEIARISGACSLDLPDEIKNFKFIYVGSNHKGYIDNREAIVSNIQSGATILDNQGIWCDMANEFASRGIRYFRVGSPGWLSLVESEAS
jgi:hypothetical protein